ncbi:MAG: hypothetical protein H6550_05380 [Chitinophagales bacterium]|nr:hypothetical protein [Chitinophagales bacterium]
MIKFYDCYLKAIGLVTGYFMDAQSEPEILSYAENVLEVKITCWEQDENELNGIKDADYSLQIKFINVIGYQVLAAELPPYRLDSEGHDLPPFIFEIDYNSGNLLKLMQRSSESWYPKLIEIHDPTLWYALFWRWKPWKRKIKLPPNSKNYLICGHDTYMEVLAESFEVQQK